jgi:uncharacterized protein YndB with AHSA1/START domain
MQTIHFTISQTIHKPKAEVFHSVVDPDILSSYFTKSSSGPMKKGAALKWTWPGADEEGIFYVDDVIAEEKIESHWQAWKVEYDVNTKFEFIAKDDNTTVVQITESGFHNDDIGHESAFGQCQGWTHMLMCLKARLEFGIDIR